MARVACRRRFAPVHLLTVNRRLKPTPARQDSRWWFSDTELEQTDATESGVVTEDSSRRCCGLFELKSWFHVAGEVFSACSNWRCASAKA